MENEWTRSLAEKDETIAGLETEIFRLQGMISLMYGCHETILKNFETNNHHMINMMKNFIPRKE